MNDIHDLLERIPAPPTDPNDDVSRGERALRRRRGWQATAAGLSVAAVIAAGVALHGSSTASGAGRPGVADRPAAPSTPAVPSAHTCGQDAHGCAPTASGHQAKKHRLTEHERIRQLRQQLDSPITANTLRTYHDVLAEHLDPTGTKLRMAQNEQGGGGSIGTKLDWNDGGMLEIVVGRSWAAAGGFYVLESARMIDTTFHGQPARVSTAGDDLVVSVRHDDGTVVTLIASTAFGNNGTSTSSLGLTRGQLLAAAADPRLTLPPYLR